MREIKEVNELFLITVITGIVGSYVFFALGLSNSDMIVSLLYSQFILVLPTIIYVLVRKISIRELFRFNKIKVGTVFLTILFAYLIMPLMQEINLISMLFAKNEISSKMYTVVESKPFVISLLSIAVVPALLEESVYRGCFFNVYSEKSPLKAILLSALLFGFMHLNFNQFSYAFIMGMIFCLLVEGTDSIITSMIIHFIVNGTSVVTLYLTPVIQKLTSSVQGADAEMLIQDVDTMPKEMLLMSIAVYGLIACFTTVLAALVFIAIIKHEGRFEHIKNMFRRTGNKSAKIYDVTGESFLSLPLVLGCGICIAYMILNEIV